MGQNPSQGFRVHALLSRVRRQNPERSSLSPYALVVGSWFSEGSTKRSLQCLLRSRRRGSGLVSSWQPPIWTGPAQTPLLTLNLPLQQSRSRAPATNPGLSFQGLEWLRSSSPNKKVGRLLAESDSSATHECKLRPAFGLFLFQKARPNDADQSSPGGPQPEVAF